MYYKFKRIKYILTFAVVLCSLCVFLAVSASATEYRENPSEYGVDYLYLVESEPYEDSCFEKFNELDIESVNCTPYITWHEGDWVYAIRSASNSCSITFNFSPILIKSGGCYGIAFDSFNSPQKSFQVGVNVNYTNLNGDLFSISSSKSFYGDGVKTPNFYSSSLKKNEHSVYSLTITFSSLGNGQIIYFKGFAIGATQQSEEDFRFLKFNKEYLKFPPLLNLDGEYYTTDEYSDFTAFDLLGFMRSAYSLFDCTDVFSLALHTPLHNVYVSDPYISYGLLYDNYDDEGVPLCIDDVFTVSYISADEGTSFSVNESDFYLPLDGGDLFVGGYRPLIPLIDVNSVSVSAILISGNLEENISYLDILYDKIVLDFVDCTRADYALIADILTDYGKGLGYSDGYSGGYDVGYDKGLTDGGDLGYDRGYTKGFADGEELGLNMGFTDGYSEGERAGHIAGYNEGLVQGELFYYDKGLSDGYANGYELGYSDGLAYEGIDFNDLIITTAQAVGGTIVSLLDWNILGVNILSLVGGVILLGLCIPLIKFFKG